MNCLSASLRVVEMLAEELAENLDADVATSCSTSRMDMFCARIFGKLSASISDDGGERGRETIHQ